VQLAAPGASPSGLRSASRFGNAMKTTAALAAVVVRRSRSPNVVLAKCASLRARSEQPRDARRSRVTAQEQRISVFFSARHRRSQIRTALGWRYRRCRGQVSSTATMRSCAVAARSYMENVLPSSRASSMCRQPRPNPSVEARPNGVALGPRGALVQDAPRGPSTTPLVPPHLER
jgi:hypothetical protein